MDKLNEWIEHLDVKMEDNPEGDEFEKMKDKHKAFDSYRQACESWLIQAREALARAKSLLNSPPEGESLSVLTWHLGIPTKLRLRARASRP